MICIYCKGDTRVVNSRLQKRLNQVWRRRQCLNCNAVFSSRERIDFATSLLVRHNGHGGVRGQFTRDTLFISIYQCLNHRKDAISEATALTATVISKLLPKIKHASIERDTLVKTTAEVLKRYDKAAYTLYLAYHPLHKP